jgi:KDO2-lipid IV(A) lauroyltransferase
MKKKLSPFLQSKFNIFIYLSFGWVLARFYIFLLGKLYFFFNKQEKEIIANAVVDVMGGVRQSGSIEEIVRKAFHGIFCHYYEKLFIAFEDKDKATEFLNDHILSDDLSVLSRSLLRGKGVIVITGHYGAIEFIPTLLAVNGFDVSMIAKFKTERLKKQVFSQAQKYNIRLIDAEKKGSILKKAIKELNENRVLVTQCDEIDEWRPSEKKRTSFLGRVTGLDRTINVIQKRTGAEVVFGVIHRYNLSKYKLIMYSYEDMLKMLEGVPVSTVGETVLKVLEQFILYHPEQWYQWKKYPQIKTKSIAVTKAEKPSSSRFLQPVFEKAL